MQSGKRRMSWPRCHQFLDNVKLWLNDRQTSTIFKFGHDLDDTLSACSLERLELETVRGLA